MKPAPPVTRRVSISGAKYIQSPPMPILHAIVLAIVQGATEFIPVSSSAHLILVPYLLGWPDRGLAFDVAGHVGTMLAALLYFRHDVAELVTGFFSGRRLPGGDFDPR